MAEPIKDRNVIRTKPITLSPIFTLPTDFSEGEYDDTHSTSGGGSGGGGGGSEGVGDGVDPNFPTPTERPQFPPTIPPTPVLMSVKSQTVRIAPDGKTVVDVVIEVEDFKGVSTYEARVTKQ